MSEQLFAENLVFTAIQKMVEASTEETIGLLKAACIEHADLMSERSEPERAEYWRNVANEIDDAWRAEKIRRAAQASRP